MTDAAPTLDEQIEYAVRLRLAVTDVMGNPLAGHEKTYALRTAILQTLRTATLPAAADLASRLSERALFKYGDASPRAPAAVQTYHQNCPPCAREDAQ